ncbi:MAG: hypothetical protein J5I98_06495 [Phaeodactylibacter sp.]|nr:hypothetical protein [Phaeodactylibacter sp.]
MKRNILLLLFSCCLNFSLSAQADAAREYRNFPIVVTLQFHSLALPFRNLKTNFSNVGIGLGTEVSYNGKNNWAQQLTLAWYRNRAIGNGLLLYTQSAWRPTASSGIFAEIKAGVGYLYAFRPVKSFRQQNGDWVSAGHKGKGMLAVPAGISLGYDNYALDTYFSPFASYQFLLAKGYNKSIPLVPETLIQAGTRIHFK